jgi:hypothetical protein
LLKIIAGIAGIVFLRAPFTSDGVLVTLCSVVIAVVCVAALKASEGEKNPDL